MNSQNKKRIIVVLGMHRSGTSAITRSLQALGVDLGNNLEPPVPGINEKGFYEDLEINRLNVELLYALDSDWHELSIIPAAAFDQENLAPFKLQALELMSTRMGDQPFGLKNPRFGRMLPFWHAIFKHLNLSPSYVIASRHPMSVMHSLKKRDGFDNEKGYYLWLEHVIPSLLETLGANRLVVDFDMLMADPLTQLERMAQALNLPFDSDSSQVREYIGDFLDEKLRHTKYEFEDLRIDPTVPLDVITAYEALVRLARDEINIDAPEVVEVFVQLNSRLQSLCPALNYMTRLEKKVAVHSGQIVNLKQVVLERDEQIASLKQVVLERDEQIASLKQVVLERDEQIASLKQVVLERDGQLARLNQAVLERDGLLASLNQAVLERNVQIASIYQSNSWRLTSPLRILRTLVGRSQGFTPRRRMLNIFLAVRGLVCRLGQQTDSTISSHATLHVPPPDAQHSAMKLESPVPRYAPLALTRMTEQQTASAELPSVAVHIHVHYTDLLDELMNYTSNLPGKVDLFVTTTQPGGSIAAQVQARFPHATVWQTQNRGKDLGPFIDAIKRHQLDKYDLVLKLHSKKSLNLPKYLKAVQGLFGKEIRNGDDWRRGLITSLAANQQRVEQIYQAFAADATLGMVGAARFICRAPDVNGVGYEALCQRLGISPHILFFGGTIFWIRGRHLRHLRQAGLTLQDFDVHSVGNVENTLEHACERVFGALVAADGGWIGGIE